MWVVYVGLGLHSAWNKEDDAIKYQDILTRMGKTGVRYQYSDEFKGCFNNGYLFN